MHKKYLPQIFCILLGNIYLKYIKDTTTNQYCRIKKLDKKTNTHFLISCNAFLSFIRLSSKYKIILLHSFINWSIKHHVKDNDNLK